VNHEHTFELHIGIKVFGRRATAWVPWPAVSGPGLVADDALEMLRCLKCGEQGYEVPA